jgi:hypothetical protein
MSFDDAVFEVVPPPLFSPAAAAPACVLKLMTTTSHAKSLLYISLERASRAEMACSTEGKKTIEDNLTSVNFF